MKHRIQNLESSIQPDTGRRDAHGRAKRNGRAHFEVEDSGIVREELQFLRIFPRSFTFLRTDQGRGYAILRIFTGETNFSES